MTTLTPTEQLYLELINRARLDPLGEAKRLGIDLNVFVDLSKDAPINGDPKQPLAPNSALTQAARKHAANIWADATFQATGSKSNPHEFDGKVQDRIAAAGYSQNQLAKFRNENWSVNQDGAAISDKLIEDLVYRNHNGLFKDDPKFYGPGAGHRLGMLDGQMKEAGIADITGKLGTGNSTNIVVQNFGVSGTNSFITGVVYNDTRGAIVNGKEVGDHFYSLGEAVSGVTVTLKQGATPIGAGDVTGSGGGFSVAEPATPGALYTITFSGGGLAKPVSAIVDPGILNAKVDLVNGKEINSSANITLGDNAFDLRLLGISNINGTGNGNANVITGNAGNNVLTGLGGNDIIDGGNGTDTAVFSGKMSDYKIVLNGTSATIEDLRAGSPDGSDTISNVELVNFGGTIVPFSSLKNQIPPAPVAGSVSIVAVNGQVDEGNAGTKTMTFKVTRSGGTAAFDVNFAAADVTAKVSDGDYSLAPGILRFAANETEKLITVVINGDTKFEGTETFNINLSNATNGANIAGGTATGTILNDDANHAPTVTGNKVTLAAGGSVAVTSIFTAQDQDGNSTITKYAFWDAGKNGGFFTVNGVAQAPGAWIEVNVSDLAKVKYVGSVNGGAEQLFAKAFDGNVWSGNVSVDATTLQRAPSDFTGDGNSDILFHNNSGAVAMWQMDGFKTLANVGAGTQATSWHAQDAFDFNGDGKADILWHNTNGQVQLWQMNGAQAAQKLDLGSMATSWHIAGVDDFTGDGKAEVLWHNTGNGQVQMWNMDGANHTTTNVGTIAAGWTVQDTADFNGDGKADLLLRNGSNVSMWQMDGAKVGPQSNYTMGDAFHFAGTGDFNADGKADILWHNDATGQLVLWEMNGANILSNTSAGFTAKGWDVAQIGDFNHDGKADLLLQNATTGAIAEWQMNGDQIQDKLGLGTVSTDWHII